MPQAAGKGKGEETWERLSEREKVKRSFEEGKKREGREEKRRKGEGGGKGEEGEFASLALGG